MSKEDVELAKTHSLFRMICLICHEYFNQNPNVRSIFEIPTLWNDKDHSAHHICKSCEPLLNKLRPLKLINPKLRYPNCKHPKEERRDYGKYYFCSKCFKYVTYQKTLLEFMKK